MRKNTVVLLSFIIFLSCSGQKRTPSSTSSSVLYIGDSQSAGFLGELVFDELSKRFKESDIEVYGVGSSSPRHWADSKEGESGQWLCAKQRKGRFNKQYQIDISDHICKFSGDKTIYSHLNDKKPNFVVFQFLGNSMNQSEKKISHTINKLMSNLGNQECLFVTSPPFFHGDEEKFIHLIERNKHRVVTEDRIVKAVGDRCHIVSGMKGEAMNKFSRDRSNYGSDAIHLSKKGALSFLNHFKSYLP